MSSYWPFIVPGLVNGAIYALAATGLVLTYKTTGTFNLAFGAQAYVSAVVYYELRSTHGWSLVPGVLVAVAVVGPLLGLMLDRLVFRFLRRAPVMTRLAVGIGLLIAIPGLVTIITSVVGGDQNRLAPPSVGPEQLRFYRWGALNIDSDQLVVLIATVIVVVLLVIVVRFTALGLRMRAVVESARMSELSGTHAGRVNTLAWVISSFIAGLTGVLLAPLFATVNSTQFTFLVVAAIAAAAFGGLTSIPLAVAGGLVLGVTQGLLVKWLPLGSVLAQGLRPSLPFVMLFVLLVFRRRGSSTRPADPLAGVDPPPRVAGGGQLKEMALPGKLALTAAGAAVSVLVLSDYWIGISSRALIFSTIFLSLTLLTGMSGHISLCQASFVGIGAFVAGQLAVEQEMSLLLGMFVGGAVAAIGGATLAVLALRLGGLYLALATLAFGFLADNIIFVQTWALGDIRGLDVPRPLLGPIDFTSDTAFFLLTAVVFALALVLMHAVRGGATGQLLISLRGSETGAQSIGVDPTPIKIKVFALSAGIAGVGGGLLGSQQGAISTINFISFQSLYWMVVVLAVGVYTVRGAVAAGFLLVFLPELLSHLSEPYLALQFVVFGLGVINLARHPEGALDYLLFLPQRIRERRAA